MHRIARFIDHVDLRVRSARAATPFYDAFFGALGLRRMTADDVAWVEYAYADGTTPYFALTSEAGHRGNANRIAFAADSRVEVDQAWAAVRDTGAVAIEGPGLCPEYDPTYYAVFFEDSDGNRFEVCCHAG